MEFSDDYKQYAVDVQVSPSVNVDVLKSLQDQTLKTSYTQSETVDETKIGGNDSVMSYRSRSGTTYFLLNKNGKTYASENREDIEAFNLGQPCEEKPWKSWVFVKKIVSVKKIGNKEFKFSLLEEIEVALKYLKEIESKFEVLKKVCQELK